MRLINVNNQSTNTPYLFIKAIRISKLTIILSIFILLINSCYNEKVIATVGSTEIKESEFIERYEDYLIRTGVKDNILSRKEVINSMVTEVLLEQFDDNSRIEKNDEYQRELKWIKKQAVLGFLKDREVYRNIKVSDEEVRKAFLQSNQKLAARHLYAKTEEEINNLAELLKIGVDFNTLAKQTFTDSTLRNNGGYIGYFSWGDMDPAFEEKAYSLKVGEISDPVKTEQGYSIIKLEDKVTRPLITENEFLNKKEKFAQILRIKKKKPAEKEFINKVVDFNEIKFNDNLVDQLWKELEASVKNNSRNLENNSTDGIVVSYKKKQYKFSDIKDRLFEIPNYHFKNINSKKKLKTALKGLILQESLLKLAEEKGFDKSEYVTKKLSNMKTNLLMKYKISEIMANSIIDDSLVYNFYKDNPDFFSTHDELNVQEILVDNLELAKEVKNKINGGAKFETLAKKYSIRKQSAEKGGIIGFMPTKNFGRFKRTFSNAKLKELIGPLELNSYYGLFRVIGKKKSEIIEFQKVKDLATEAVKYKYRNDILADYVDSLKQKIGVKIDLPKLGSVKIFQFN